MARGKKKEKVLTPEEKLQQALVPESEWPYEVPGNWKWIRLLNSFDNHTDSKKKIQQKDYLEEGSIAIIDQGKEIVGGYSNNDEMRYEGTLPVIVFGDHTRCIKYIDFPFAQGADGIKILEPKEFLLPKVFFYALQSINIPNMGYRRHYPLFKDYVIPIPPLPEQQRIVDRIESLFAKLDEAKEKAQAVVDGFEDRKAAILHKAFTGELTEKWRRTNFISSNTWGYKNLEDVCKSIFDGDHMPPPKAEMGVPFLVISNVNTGHLSFNNTRFVPQDYFDNLTNTRKPEYGDILYTLVGSFGIPVIVDDIRPFCFQRHMALLKLSRVNTRFLWYQLQSQEFFNKASEIATGTAQLTVPIKGLRKLPIKLPSEEEQVELVRILDEIIKKEKQAKQAAEQVITQIDTMKKSILARAFRGELGTNDPSDENAEELLKRIL